MRTLLPALVVLLAVSATVPASPLRCADPCIVKTDYSGYLPPLVDVASGGAVVWRSVGGGHIQADTGSAPACFVTFVDGGADSEPARFEIVGGQLRANTTELGEVACANARVLPDGAHALPYECVIHPNMRGAILVRAA